MAAAHTWHVHLPDGQAIQIRTMPTRMRAARRVVRYTDGHVVAIAATGEVIANFVHFDAEVDAKQPVRYVFAIEALHRIGAITPEQRDAAYAHTKELGELSARIQHARQIRESLFALGLKVPPSLDRALDRITQQP